MSKKFLSIVSVLLIAVFALSACAPTPTPTQAAAQPTSTTAPAEPTATTAAAEPTATTAAAEPTATTAAAEPTATTAPAEPTATTASMGSDMAGSITLWHGWKENEIASLNDVIAGFQKLYPNVKIETLYVPFDDLRGKFETAASTGAGPDVLIGAADWGPGLYKAKLIADLTPLLTAGVTDTIAPAALAATQFDGALIGLPETTKGVVLFRNKKIIADPATSLDDFIAKAKAATKGDVQGADFEYGFFFSAPILNGVGGKLMDDKGDPMFNDAKGVDYVNVLTKIRDAGIPMENYTDNDVNLFKAGKAGWIIDGSWNMAPLAEAVGKDNLIIDPWFAPLSGYTQTENIYLNANATGDNQKAAAAFIEYFVSTEAQTLLADPTKAAHLPVLSSGVEIKDPLLKMAADALAKGSAFPVIPEMGAYWDPMNNALKAVVTDKKDPAAELKAAFDLVTAKIAEIRKQ